MKYRAIPISAKDQRVDPNLEDYEKTYKSFSWRDIRGDLTWFGGKLNAAYNAVDRHVDTWRGNKVALFWESEAGEKKTYTFRELSVASNKLGNMLKDFGVERGDRVFLFLPRIPELFFGFLGTLKIGAIAGTLFSAFQEQALFDRLNNAAPKVLLTTKELLPRVEKIRRRLENPIHILTVDTPDFAASFEKAEETLAAAHMDPDEYAFMLYTSGTTGKPKGVVHTHRAILQEYATARWVLDITHKDTYWCTADPGWVTGIAYGILGTWACGATTVVYEGRFDPSAWYRILAEYHVSVWYTAPTAIRMLMAAGEDEVKKYDLKDLRHLCSVGEPLNPEAIVWGMKVFKLPFHDTWWQTETGAICIANYPTMIIKPGSMGKPVPGVKAAIVDDHGQPIEAGKEGNIALKPPWPAMMKTVWRRPQKYKSYFVGGWYLSGDRGMMDRDGYFWFIGRADDVIKTAGERVGPFEVESALVSHPAVVEAGVIGKPDPMRGEIIKAFVVLEKKDQAKIKTKTDAKKLQEELSLFVKKHLAGHAYPREIEFIDKLPKTRSGKIMRRILKAKEMGLPVGDTSTLEEY
jgi:acetyl-CoA synthetase